MPSSSITAARLTLTLSCVAGLTGSLRAQESVTYTLAWSEVLAGTTTPVASPNSVIDAGEGARIRISVLVTPAIGSTATYSGGPPPGSGPIAGLGTMCIDLNQTNALGGTWSNIARPSAWALGGTATNGAGIANGTLRAAQAGQFAFPTSTALATNPITNIWQATWTPSSYSPRSAQFQSAPATATPTTHSSIWIRYAPAPNTAFYGKFVPGIFGAVSIPIAISPCYPNCDNSSGIPRLTPNDFQCFLDAYAGSQPYANCDNSTGTPALTPNDFQCFLNKYAAGCS